MSKSLQIEIANEIEDEKVNEAVNEDDMSFFDLLKESLLVFEKLPLAKVVEAVQSEQYKMQREEIQREFWNVYHDISKDDDSLECAIFLQNYGFTLTKPKKNKFFQD